VAQYRPDAATLLATVAEVLDEVLDDVPPHQQHRVRVAAHLARLVVRETQLGADAAAAERIALASLLGIDADGGGAREALAERLRAGDDEEFEAAVWGVLVESSRRDLAIAKPGYTEWTGC
jgi:hypothetical protein